jgi:hypothetical protein
LSWSWPDHATSFQLEVGSGPGERNLVIQNIGGVSTLTVANTPSGVYYVRVRGINDIGQGGASSEVRVVVQ